MNQEYNNFYESLGKEQDQQAQERLKAFYSYYYNSYYIEMIDYNTCYGKFLQSAGVDRILNKKNKYGHIEKQIWIQEKVCLSNYPNVLFEYEKKSGAKGWAIDQQERADFLLYYHDGFIMVFKLKELREWLTSNLDVFKRKYRKDTDNKNVCVPKDIVFNGLKVKCYEIDDYLNM